MRFESFKFDVNSIYEFKKKLIRFDDFLSHE